MISSKHTGCVGKETPNVQLRHTQCVVAYTPSVLEWASMCFDYFFVSVPL